MKDNKNDAKVADKNSVEFQSFTTNMKMHRVLSLRYLSRVHVGTKQ